MTFSILGDLEGGLITDGNGGRDAIDIPLKLACDGVLLSSSVQTGGTPRGDFFDDITWFSWLHGAGDVDKLPLSSTCCWWEIGACVFSNGTNGKAIRSFGGGCSKMSFCRRCPLVCVTWLSSIERNMQLKVNLTLSEQHIMHPGVLLV